VIKVHDELTKVDIKKMQEEIDYRIKVLTPKLKEELSKARAQGDLSENFEYKSAKRELGRNYSRIDYLQRMIATAKVVSTDSAEGAVGLFSKVCLYVEEDDEEESRQIVTTLRQDVLRGYLSKESPLGKALLGKKIGDRVYVKVNDNYGYYVVVRAIEKGHDDESIPISSY
jgi:transcription elongation factor GreA